MNFVTENEHRYFQNGASPQLVIMSGTHGDEYHLIEQLTKEIEISIEKLPDFLFIPEVSPSAVQLKTRTNKFGNDINRNFGQLIDPEAVSLKHLLSTTSDAVAVSFHEDLERQEFYFYDSSTLPNTILNNFQEQVKDLGIPLFTGIDDPEDPALSYYIRDGYVDFVGTANENGQFIEDWAIYGGNLTRLFTFEIPYKYQKVSELMQACIQLALKLL